MSRIIWGWQSRLGAVLVLASVILAWGAWWANSQREDPAVADSADEGEGAGLPVETPAIPFTDVTAEAGIDFVHTGGAIGQKMLPESGGSGCAWIDYDSDGDPDLLLISGRAWPWNTQEVPGSAASALALYRNDSGRFTNVTAEANLVVDLYGQGAAVGDYDSDGDDDLYITTVGADRLYRNDNGRFTDVTAASGDLGASDSWTTSAGFLDYDNDGDLDLFVCNYVNWSRESDQQAVRRVPGAGLSYAHPQNFEGTNSFLFRNDDGRFIDASAATGIYVDDPATGEPLGKALAVTFVDYDQDGWIDIFVANDTVRHFLFRNRSGVFEEAAEQLGFAVNAMGLATSGMGIDSGWIYNDRRLALSVSNFAGEMTEFFVMSGDAGPGFFTDEAVLAGVGAPTLPSLTFGLLFDDFDRDGRVDMVHANGHLEETIQQVQPEQSYRQAAQLFWNTGDFSGPILAPLPGEKLGDLAKPVVGRALAAADYDQDGDLDLLLTQAGGRPLLLRNDQRSKNHWLRCVLSGPVGNPRGIGARVELDAGGVTQRRTLMPTRSYLSQCEPAVLFGLGAEDKVDELRVIWPDGVEQRVDVDEVDTTVDVGRQESSFDALANAAMAQLENADFESAIETLRLAAALRPASGPTRRNLARAYLLGGRPADAVEELADLPEELMGPPAQAAYIRGLAAIRLSQPDVAAERFTEAVRHDPREPALHFQLALALSATGESERARVELEKTAELDPLHGGAQYQLAAFARRSGDRDAFRRYMRDYQRVRGANVPIDPLSLEACRYTEPEEMIDRRNAANTLVHPGIRWEQPVVLDSHDLLCVAVLSVDETGRYRMVGVNRAAEAVVLDWTEDSGLSEVDRSDPMFETDLTEAVIKVGNAIVDSIGVQGQAEQSDDHPEILVVTPAGARLLRYSPGDGFDDLTLLANLGEAAGRLAVWSDLDHDGDIDVCVGGESGTQVWRNNSDGAFVESSAEFGVGRSDAVTDMAAVDLDGVNLGADLIAVTPGGCYVLRNQFGGQLEIDGSATVRWPPASRIVADDFNNDGYPEAVLVGAGSLSLVDRMGVVTHESPTGWRQTVAVTPIDIDNDGWLDLAGIGRTDDATMLRVWRNMGGQFFPAEDEMLLDVANGRAQLLAIDANGDGLTDLLTVEPGGTLVLVANDTDTKNKQVKLAIQSFAGHPSSIGVRVQVKRKGLLASRWTQQELPIEVGVGESSYADAIQTLWPNGVVRNEVGVDLDGKPVRITILEFVRTSCCPFLYAWVDGSWRFVTDLLGTAPLNVSAARGVPLPPDPDESLVLGPFEDFAYSDGRVRLRITSELREAVYLDQATLFAVDHPGDCELFSLDCVSNAPARGRALVVAGELAPPRFATGHAGEDVLDAVAAVDGRCSDPGELLPHPVVGFTRPYSLEFEFDEPAEPKEALLVLTGWFRFGDSSTNIAASQRSDSAPVWPRLEAAGPDGVFQAVDVTIGVPAGNTKSIVCDLRGKLPSNVRRFRLTTNFEVRWDRIALAKARAADQVEFREARLNASDLQWHGFAALPQPYIDRPQVPDTRSITDRPPWFTTLEGWCTRYGEVDELLKSRDDRLAILNAGDGVTLEFQGVGLPALSEGSRRTLLLYHYGWIKEENPNSLPDRRIAPFPGSHHLPSAAEDDWQAKYNTRWTPRLQFLPTDDAGSAAGRRPPSESVGK